MIVIDPAEQEIHHDESAEIAALHFDLKRFASTTLPTLQHHLEMVRNLANDKGYMGQYVNGALAKTLGWLFFVVITVAAIAALPLYVLTSGGQG